MSAAIERQRSLAECEEVIERGLATFVEVGEALLSIRDGRLYRETHDTFESYCRERWGMSKTHANRQIEAAGVAGTLTPMGAIPTSERQARELAPVLRDEGEAAVVEVWRELRAEYGEDVTAERVKRLVGKRAARIRREREAELAAAALPMPEPSGDIRIEYCDIRDLDVEPGSVALIFTDPPYLGSTLDAYDALADFAAEALRPGAMLVAYTGNVWALECMNRLSRRLEFVTVGGVWMPGAHTPVHKYRLRVRLKPLVFFSRGPFEPRGWWEDLLTSPKPDKDLHPWQQSEGSGSLIEALTEPGELVCDPFLGSGTTAAVAHGLGRRFVGCDVDELAARTARNRVAELASAA
jgi:hypothetical protein